MNLLFSVSTLMHFDFLKCILILGRFILIIAILVLIVPLVYYFFSQKKEYATSEKCFVFVVLKQAQTSICHNFLKF